MWLYRIKHAYLHLKNYVKHINSPLLVLEVSSPVRALWLLTVREGRMTCLGAERQQTANDGDFGTPELRGEQNRHPITT